MVIVAHLRAAWWAALTDLEQHERDHGCSLLVDDCLEAARLRDLDRARHADYLRARLAVAA